MKQIRNIVFVCLLISLGFFQGKAQSVGSTALDLAMQSILQPMDSCADSSKQILVAIQNQDTQSIDFSVDTCLVQVEVSGANSGLFTKSISSGTLAVNDTMHVLLTANFNMAAIGAYTFQASSTLTNDPQRTNDTLLLKMNVDTLTQATFTPPGNACLNTTAVQLTASGKPGGGNGVFFGPGVLSATFHPSMAGLGSHSLGYAYTDPYGCVDTSLQAVRVDTVPQVSISALNNVCQYSPIFNLGNGMPIGGTYSGKNISSNRYDPQITGLDTVVYAYTDANGCTDSAFTTIEVDTLPMVSLVVASSYCANTPADTLRTGAPQGGTYWGNNVANSIYRPSNPGSDTLYYAFVDVNNCTDTAQTIVWVDTVPTVSLNLPNRICVQSDSLLLNMATPSGGTYWVNGDSAQKLGIQTPGMDTIHYSYTDLNGCADSVLQVLQKDSLPEVDFFYSKRSVCLYADTHQLSGGMPVGGNYRGSGVVNNAFVPMISGLGQDTLVYWYTDGNGCSDSAWHFIQVDSVPIVSFVAQQSFCSGDSASLILGANPPNGQFYGTAVTTQLSTFHPDQASIGANLVGYSFVDANGCMDTTSDYIEVEATPFFELGNDTSICGQQTLTLDVGIDSVTYDWSTGESSRSIVLSTSSIVYVSVTDTQHVLQCSYSDTIRIDYDELCVGVSEFSDQTQFRVYPNPGNNRIKLDGDLDEVLAYFIINTQGQKLPLNSDVQILNEGIDVSHLARGRYVLVLLTDRHSISLPLLLVEP